MRYGQDNSVFANMDMYRIENVVCYPFRTATLVDNETIEDQIGEGCLVSLPVLWSLSLDFLHSSICTLPQYSKLKGDG